jgi:hypothetical protein
MKIRSKRVRLKGYKGLVFEKRRDIVEDGVDESIEKERMHLKVKHINSVLENIHEYNIDSYLKGSGNHEKTFRNHMETIKSQCKYNS